MAPNNNSDWHEWSRFVLKELERLAEEQARLADEIKTLRLETARNVTALQARVGMVGAAAGLVFGGIAAAVTRTYFG